MLKLVHEKLIEIHGSSRVIREPYIKGPITSWKPDLIVGTGSYIAVVDVAIPYEMHDGSLLQSFRRKVEKYRGVKEIEEFCTQRFDTPLIYCAIVVGARGSFSKASITTLEQLQHPKSPIPRLTLKAMSGSLRTYRLFNKNSNPHNSSPNNTNLRRPPCLNKAQAQGEPHDVLGSDLRRPP